MVPCGVCAFCFWSNPDSETPTRPVGAYMRELRVRLPFVWCGLSCTVLNRLASFCAALWLGCVRTCGRIADTLPGG